MSLDVSASSTQTGAQTGDRLLIRSKSVACHRIPVSVFPAKLRGWRLGLRLLVQKHESLILCVLMCEAMHMATNLAIDQRLLEKAVEVSGEKTKTAAVTLALEEFIARREQEALLDLFGSLEWNQDYDYKAERDRA